MAHSWAGGVHRRPTFWLLSVAILASGPARAGELQAGYRLTRWERGLSVESAESPSMRMYLWFYEWHMFGAVTPEQHSKGTFEARTAVAGDGQQAEIVSATPGIRLTMRVVEDGALMTLTVTNRSQRDWPQLAAIAACFNPGPPPRRRTKLAIVALAGLVAAYLVRPGWRRRKGGHGGIATRLALVAVVAGAAYWVFAFNTRNRQFVNTRTVFASAAGLEPLALTSEREIHFNHALRAAVEAEADPEKGYEWSHKWPMSEVDAVEPVLLRESNDGRWVTGIAWDRFLSAQGHNPWACMHLSTLVGPLARGESRTIRGKIYLFRGDRDDLLARYRRDFPRPDQEEPQDE